jgi:Phage lysozyme.
MTQGVIDDFEIAKSMLIRDEGDQRHVYECGTGLRVYAEQGYLTIGIGHNLDARPLSDAVRDLLFSEDWAIALSACQSLYPHYSRFSQARRLALLNMAFNLGERRLGKFTKMNEAINSERWEDAAKEAADSLWFYQVKGRAVRICQMLKEDVIPGEYWAA